MMTNTKRVRVFLPNSGRTFTYKSITSAARVLSGNGTSGLRSTIARKCNAGGGRVKNVWVEYA